VEPVVISFVWDEEHYIRAMAIYGRSWGMRVLTLLSWAFTAYLLWIAWSYAAHDDATLADSGPYVALYLLLAAIMLYLRGPFQGLRMRRNFRKRTDPQHEIRYVIDDEGFKAETVGLAKSEFNWGMPVKAMVADEALLVFLTPRQYQYVPLDGLDAADRERLLAKVEEKIENIKLV